MLEYSTGVQKLGLV